MKLSTLIPVSLAALLGVSTVASAQGGGFTAGDIYVAGHQGGSPPTGLVRLDPLSGDAAMLKKYFGISYGSESLAFDPYRQRLILMARLDQADGVLWRPYLTDAAGNFAPLDPPVASWNGLSPTGDGRIYYRDMLTSVLPFKWLDAANQVHVLYDTDGVTPFLMDGFSTALEDMIYVASENALITVTSGISPWSSCPGGNGSSLHVRKIPLTADGTRLSGPMSCSEYDVVGWDGEVSAGFSLMPDGDLLLGAHTGVYTWHLARLVRVDTSTLAMTSFALFGDASNGGTTWSSALGKAVAQTHFFGQLLAYSEGQVDDGVAVPSSIPFQDTRYAVEEIRSLACDGGWIAYGSGLAGKGGFVPRLYGKGCAEPGGVFELKLDQAVGGASGALFVGFTPTALPFKGGTLLVAPIAMQFTIAVGGTPGVAGAGAVTLPGFLPNNPGLTGFSLFLQAAFSDGAAVQDVSLTQGLELEIG
jgi:hypothetical protein